MRVHADPAGRLAENVVHFARVLRASGLRNIGSDRIALALQALPLAGLESRRDLHATLAACLLTSGDQRLLFDQAFHLFWRDPDLMGRAMAMLLPRVQGRAGAPPPPENRRLAGALFPPRQRETPLPPIEQEPVELDVALAWSEREQLRRRDFETMTSDEWQAARRLVAELPLAAEALPTRRQRSATRPGRPDWHATLRQAARSGDLAHLRWRRPRTRPAPLVVLLDISGSMSRYARMLLHFVHALANRGRGVRQRIACFTLGTRLTPITTLLRERDPDAAIAAVSARVADWSGGTRLRDGLHAFHRDWARRVLPGNATVLLVTDGLEHGEPEGLAHETALLQRRCRRLVWLNPLLRFDGFEPRAAGIRAMLPHVDEFRPAHHLDSLADLAQALAAPGARPSSDHDPRRFIGK